MTTQERKALAIIKQELEETLDNGLCTTKPHIKFDLLLSIQRAVNKLNYVLNPPTIEENRYNNY